MAEIKKIQLGSTEYDIAAKYLLDESGNLKTYENIVSLIDAGFEIVVLDELPEANATTYATYKDSLVLVPNSGSGTNVKDEYVIVRTKPASTYVYAWEKIGSTDVDLTDYAKKTEAAKPDTYTSSTPSTNATSAAGAATLTTSSAGGETATGTATISYQKAAAATGEAGGFEVTPVFTGTTATISLSADYQPAGSISGSQTVAAHSHDVNVGAIGAAQKQSVVTGIPEFSGGSKAADVFTPNGDDIFTPNGDDSFTAASLKSGFYSAGSAASLTYSAKSNVMYNATVSSSGVLSWSTATLDHITGWTTNTPAAIDVTKFSGGSFTQGAKAAFTQGAKAAFSEGTFTPASLGTLSKADVLKSLPTITIGSAGAYTVSGSNFSFAGETATITVSGNYQPAGSIGKITIASHTHSVGSSTATVTGTAAVAVSAHTHEVTIASHTHDLGNHTHSVQVVSIA